MTVLQIVQHADFPVLLTVVEASLISDPKHLYEYVKRAWQGYLLNTTDGRRVYSASPFGTQELQERFTNFKRRSIYLENLSKEA